MTQTQSAEQQFLMGGESVPSAFTKHDGPGTRRGGRITETPQLRQQTDFDSGELLTWDDGNPRMHLVVTVTTEQRDPANPDDDGRRRFYVKGNLQRVVREAVQRANAPGLEVGGSLFVTRTGRDEPKRKGMDGAWLHSAEYVPAAQNHLMSGGGEGGNGAQAAQPSVPQQQTQTPAQQQAAPAQNQVRNETGTDPALLAVFQELNVPVDQQNAIVAAGITADMARAMLGGAA